MAKVKQKISINEEDDAKIRRQWDMARSRYYYSITDVIGVLTESVDARNYWKALKNRLKNSQNQLVSECNQLKLPSTDGKSYLVDVADRDTLIKIIKIIDPTSIPSWQSWFDHIELKNSIIDRKNSQKSDFDATQNSKILESEHESFDELSTTLQAPFDMYINGSEIFVKFMLPGCDIDKLILAVSMEKLTIKGERISPVNLKNSENFSQEYIVQELQWGKFYREINLPSLVDVDQIEATEYQGLITIKLVKVDKNKNRFIKIKSI